MTTEPSLFSFSFADLLAVVVVSFSCCLRIIRRRMFSLNIKHPGRPCPQPSSIVDPLGPRDLPTAASKIFQSASSVEEEEDASLLFDKSSMTRVRKRHRSAEHSHTLRPPSYSYTPGIRSAVSSVIVSQWLPAFADKILEDAFTSVQASAFFSARFVSLEINSSAMSAALPGLFVLAEGPLPPSPSSDGAKSNLKPPVMV
mmetsp:Transcript_7744/g.16780  ORF Transcript_7744/g.16780 Transcript_7744/m.16780 type:complete len:200 (-) Transcript_7744:129-728(-)